MFQEEQERNRLVSEQTALEEQVTSAELILETSKIMAVKFQHR